MERELPKIRITLCMLCKTQLDIGGHVFNPKNKLCPPCERKEENEPKVLVEKI